VYQLRKSLGLDELETRPTGYSLVVPRSAVDALQFEDSVGTATGAPDPAPAEVASRLTEALASWRGPALADFEGAAWARPEATRLESLRLDATERLIDARLALGEHRAVVPELESLVTTHPLRERFSAQLMLALYRSDRQADALRLYTRLREHLRDELGIDPSPEVAELEAAMLAHAPELAAPPPARPPAPSPTPPTPPAPRRGRTLIACAAVAALVAVIGIAVAIAHKGDSRAALAPPTAYRPAYRSTTCPPEISTGDASVQCGVLRVPENRALPHGRQIELGVYRFPARTKDPADDPVVQVGSVFRLAEPPGDAALRERNDSIYLSGRGFFGSNPRLTCPEVDNAANASLARPLRDPSNTTAFVQAAAHCRARWIARSVDLAMYSTAERADDVRDLALVLHLNRINIVAAGPAADDAREIAGRYPALVRSVTLFNVTPAGPDENPWNGEITNAAAALDRFVGECTNDRACNLAYPHLRRRLVNVYNRLERTPQTFTVPDPTRPHARVPILLDGDRAMQLAVLALDEPDSEALIPEALTNVRSGPAVAEFAADRLILNRDASWGALLSRVCIDEIGSVGRGGINLEAQATPLLAYLADDPLLDVCGAWKTPPAQSYAPPPGNTPTLVLEGDLEPFTSNDWAQEIARTFGRTTVVELPHLGRVATSSNPCVLRLRAGFLADPQRAIPTDACAREIPSIHFAGT
jgi:hypothetical protein